MANIAEKENVGVGLIEKIRIAHLPVDVQAVIQKMEIDKDGDGTIDAYEVGTAFKKYGETKKDNKNLRYLVVGLVLFSILLIFCVFGASITATRLSKDTSVDPVSGIMYQKGSNRPIQTVPVEIRKEGVTINEMETEQLDVLQKISLDDGAIKFQVTGYAKSLPKNQVTLLVDGGSLIYGEEGLVAATGKAETMFHFVYPDNTVSVEEGVRRTLRKLDGEKENIKISSSYVDKKDTERYCDQIMVLFANSNRFVTHCDEIRGCV